MGRLYEESILKEEEFYGNTSIISSALSSMALIIGAVLLYRTIVLERISHCIDLG